MPKKMIKVIGSHFAISPVSRQRGVYSRWTNHPTEACGSISAGRHIKSAGMFVQRSNLRSARRWQPRCGALHSHVAASRDTCAEFTPRAEV